jgi:NADH-ubiquinone oxidoreductase chain 1
MNNLYIFNFINFFNYFTLTYDEIISWRSYTELFIYDPIIEGLLYGLNIGLKSSILIFIFIWARASFPRIRFDQLMSFCWTVLLPILFALIILIPCVLFSYNIYPINIYLL